MSHLRMLATVSHRCAVTYCGYASATQSLLPLLSQRLIRSPSSYHMIRFTSRQHA